VREKASMLPAVSWLQRQATTMLKPMAVKRDSRLATQPAGVAIKKVIYLPHLTSSP
jgi:hypothetical protein